MANEVRLEGFDQFENKLVNLPKEVLEEVDGECFDAIKLWEQLSKNRARKDTGRMYQNITSHKLAFLNYELSDPVHYAPYNEWGTINKVSVPAELSAYAIQFKGRGIRKTGGITPQPFFFPPKDEIKDFLIRNINQILTTEH